MRIYKTDWNSRLNDWVSLRVVFMKVQSMLKYCIFIFILLFCLLPKKSIYKYPHAMVFQLQLITPNICILLVNVNFFCGIC